MASSVADVFIETLVNAGVNRVFGVVGDSLNGLTDVIRRGKQLEWIHVRHEEVAAFAAGAEAHLTGTIAVCAGSCGPGNLHLINGLFDCHRNRVPVLAIAAQIPSHEVGSGYFQETHPKALEHNGPALVEVAVNRQELSMPPTIDIEQAFGFGLYLIRAVLSGRGDEVIDLATTNLLR